MLKTDEIVAIKVDRVLRSVRRLDMTRDYWQRQGAMSAFFAWSYAPGIELATQWLNQAIADQTADGRLCRGGFTDVATHDLTIMRRFVLSPSCTCYFVAPLLDLYDHSPNSRYLEAAERQLIVARSGLRTSDGFLLMNESEMEVWIDEVYPVCSPMARLGTLLGRPEWVDDAYHQLIVCDQRLANPETGLLRHVWAEAPPYFPEPSAWSRGIGWFIAAAADVLAAAPAHRHASPVRERLLQVLRSMLERQDPSGLLHDVVDDAGTPLETTGTLLFVYAIARLWRLGLISDADSLHDGATRGLRAVATEVHPDGAIGRCSLPPGGPGAPMGSMVLAQSLYLLAAATFGGQTYRPPD